MATEKLPESTSPATAHILIVEDDASNADTLAALISNSGHKAVIFDQGKPAIMAAVTMTQVFDLIICDYCLPDMDGIYLIQEIRKISHYLKVPVILISAMDIYVVKDLCKQLEDYQPISVLCKPFDPTAFMNTIESYLAHARG